MESIDYYNKYANQYFEDTVNLDMGENLEKFISYLPEGAEVLDLGCGSGRDSLYFLQRGFDVTAVDGSGELCELASIHIGQDVLRMEFSDLDFHEVFDGVWACASLLHTNVDELNNTLVKVINSLKPGGVLYMSFKYGNFHGYRNGRYFNDMNAKALKELVANLCNLKMIEVWKSNDIRTDHNGEVWINILAKKITETGVM